MPALTVGQVLERARLAAGLSLRQVVERTGVPLTSVYRLLHDEVARPDPGHLARVAAVLDLGAAEVFAAAGYPPPAPDGLEAALRAVYGHVPQAGIDRMTVAVEQIAADYPQDARRT